MITLALINNKGGDGKTTWAAHIAGGLALRGYRVGWIDADSQGHAALSVGLEKENGLYALLVDKCDVRDVARTIPLAAYGTPEQVIAGGALHLIPGDVDTFLIPLKLHGALSLRQRLNEMQKAFNLDVCIIDTPPSASGFTSAIYYASDGIVLVTQCEMLSLDGVKESLRQLREHNAEREAFNYPELPLAGIIPNKLRANTKVHRDLIAQLAESFAGRVWSPIKLSAKWSDASSYQRLLFAHAPNSGEAKAAWEIAARVESVLHG